jgi:hypothetical protein
MLTSFSLTKYPFDSISWNRTGIFVRPSEIFSDRVPFGGKVVKNAFSWSIQKCLVSMQTIYQQFYVDKNYGNYHKISELGKRK